MCDVEILICIKIFCIHFLWITNLDQTIYLIFNNWLSIFEVKIINLQLKVKDNSI